MISHSKITTLNAGVQFPWALGILLAVMLISISGCGMSRTVTTGQAGPVPETVDMQQTVTVDRGDVVDTLQIGGQMNVRRKVELVFDLPVGVETRIESLTVEVGQVVEGGQTVAQIESVPLERAVEEAELDWQSAQAELEQLKEEASESALALAEVDVAKARLDLRQAQKRLDDLQKPEVGALETKVADAEHALALAELNLSIAEKQDSVGKVLRDFEYTRAWQVRRHGELEQLIAQGDANLEQKALFEELKKEMEETEYEQSLAQRAANADLSAAQAAVQNAEDALADARKDLAEAQGDPTSLEITKIESMIEAAEITLARAEEKQEKLLAGVDPEKLADAQAKVAKRLRTLEEAQEALDHLTLEAPFAGVVSYVPARAGDNITAGTTIVMLNDLSTMRAMARVDEVDIMRLREGMDVQLTFDAFPDATLTGIVGPIPLEKNTQDQYSAAVYYEVPVEFDYGELPLKPDMSVTLGFELKRSNDVLRLPTMGLQSELNGTFVEVVRAGGGSERVEVETGVSDGLFTEIVAGLEVGDEVVVPMIDPTQFQDMIGF